MLSLFRFIFRFFVAISIFFTSMFSPAVINPPTDNLPFSYLEYPAEAVKTLEESGITEKELISRANADKELYEEAQGYSDVNGVVISPYYSAKINDTQIPVYAATVFIGETQKGALHSYSEIYIEKGTDFSFNVKLKSESYILFNATVLPKSLETEASCRFGTVTASIDDFGIYTFLFNGAEQEHAYTLFVREKADEDAEIQNYIDLYGEENVKVFEKGVHYLDYLNFTSDNSIVYLKQGAYLIANHKYDITCEEDESKYIEENALASNSIGLTRFPFINFFRCNNVKVIGNGVIDLSHLDRRERRGIVFNFCNNIEVEGIKIINSPEWSFITYRCENVEISETDIFGYRQNSDAYALCNTMNATVDNCFARSGDDLFDVKALGGSGDAASRNVTFTNCIAWAGKARCFGICGEVCREISNITFKDCAVIYRDATWDDDRIASLAIVVEQDGGWISDITFENIEIFRDDGRAIACLIYEDDIENFSIKNIRFKNISYVSCLPSKISTQNKISNEAEISFENITYAGFELDKSDSMFFEFDEYIKVEFK